MRSLVRRPTQADFDLCHGGQHIWFDINAERPSSVGWAWWKRCDCCDSIRKDIFDIHGNLSSRQYVYSRGYKQSKEMKMTKAEYRLRILKRGTTMAAPNLPRKKR